MSPTETLDIVLNHFQEWKTHMAVVRASKPVTRPGAKQNFENIGLLTMEDVIEKLIQEEIHDETDNEHFHKQFINDMKRIQYEKGGLGLHLPEKEVETAANFLLQNFPETFPSDETNCTRERFWFGRVKQLVRSCAPLHKAPVGEHELFLWQRGDNVDHCYLVLSGGPLRVLTGDQAFASEVGPWRVLGLEALTNPKYKPDYSLQVVHAVTLLKFSRDAYQQMKEVEPQHIARSSSFDEKSSESYRPASPNFGAKVGTDISNAEIPRAVSKQTVEKESASGTNNQQPLKTTNCPTDQPFESKAISHGADIVTKLHMVGSLGKHNSVAIKANALIDKVQITDKHNAQ